MQAIAGSSSPGARVFAWGGALLFLASLSYFLYAYGVTYGEIVLLPPLGRSHTLSIPPDGGSYTRPIAINFALFTLFAFHHSLFARASVKAWLARIAPPYLERSLYVWIASALFIAVCAAWQPVPGVLWDVTGPLRWVMFAGQAAGAWLAVRSAAILDVFELSGVRQLEPQPPRVTEFKTVAGYGWVRHPIYSGWFLMVFAAPTMTGTRLVFAVVSCVYLLMAIPWEERSLRATAGEAYARYSRQVRWKLIPGVY